MSKRWLELSVKVSFEYVEPVFNIFSKYSDNKVVLIETKNRLLGKNENPIEIVGWIDYDSEFCNIIKHQSKSQWDKTLLRIMIGFGIFAFFHVSMMMMPQ